MLPAYEFPEENCPLRLITVAREYVASGYHVNGGRCHEAIIKTLLSYYRGEAYHSEISSFAARVAVNKDEVLLGYIVYGQQNKTSFTARLAK